MKSISEIASPATLERRARAGRDRQSRWYKKRYAGGRIGEKPPAATPRMLNDSGRFADGMVVRLRQTSGGHSVATLNVPANRLDPKTFGSAGEFRRLVELIRRHVPILGSRTGDPRVKAEITKALKDLQAGLLATSEVKYLALLRKRRQAIMAALRAAGGFIA